MQTFCIVGHIKKYAKVQRYLEDWEETGDIAKHRYRVLCFYDKHGLEATLDAFSISRRTLGLLQHLHKDNFSIFSYHF